MSLRALPTALMILATGLSGAAAETLPTFLSVPAPGSMATCGAVGRGVLLPGTDTCLRVGGEVWADVTAGPAAALQLAPVPAAPLPAPVHRSAAVSLRPEGRLSVDARTETAYGPMRVYLSVKSRQTP